MGNIGTEIGQALGLALKKASSTGSGMLESDTSIQPYTRDEYACIMILQCATSRRYPQAVEAHCFHESQADQNSQMGHPILDV